MITKKQVEEIFSREITGDQFSDLLKCLKRFHINTPLLIAHFLAQVAHESGGLRWLIEIGSGRKYEGRKDLGNTNPGDGEKYKGAGGIMLTGKYNYLLFSEFVGDQKVMRGAKYVAENYPLTAAGFWWHDNNMNQLIRDGATCRKVSARVNGKDPANGLADRERYFKRACMVLGVKMNIDSGEIYTPNEEEAKTKTVKLDGDSKLARYAMDIRNLRRFVQFHRAQGVKNEKTNRNR